MPAKVYHFETMRTARLLVGCAVLFDLLAVVLVPAVWRLGVYGGLAAVGLVLLALGSSAVALGRSDDIGWFEFERRMRRTFRQVCLERNLTGTIGKDNRPLYPTYGRLIGSADAFRLVIRPHVGQTVADWEKAAPAFSLAYESRAVRFENMGNGRIVMKVGTQMVGAMPIEVAAEQVLDDSAASWSWRDYLATVEIGTNEHGEPFHLPLIDSHTLIAGITGSGKGSVENTVILRLLPAVNAGVVRLWAFDPKRVELALSRELYGDRYAAKPDELLALVKRAYKEMMTRSDALAGKARKFEPSRKTPLEVLVIDELGFMAELMETRDQQKEMDRALKALLMLGRALGFTVIGSLQDPRKSTLDVRDMFPNRVAMRLPKPMVDLVLGNGMYEAGAHCDLIPFKVGAGGAYVLRESSTVPEYIRVSWCSDEAIRKAAGSFVVADGPKLVAGGEAEPAA